MPDYTAYVIAVYALAFSVYGGLTLLWWRTAQAIEARVAQHSPPDSTHVVTVQSPPTFS